jgi:hypothetical protein
MVCARYADPRLAAVYEAYYRFAGEEAVTVPETIRFMGQDQAAAFLAGAGLTQVTWYGDRDWSPVSPASPELIAVARGVPEV